MSRLSSRKCSLPYVKWVVFQKLSQISSDLEKGLTNCNLVILQSYHVLKKAWLIVHPSYFIFMWTSRYPSFSEHTSLWLTRQQWKRIKKRNVFSLTADQDSTEREWSSRGRGDHSFIFISFSDYVFVSY